MISKDQGYQLKVSDRRCKCGAWVYLCHACAVRHTPDRLFVPQSRGEGQGVMNRERRVSSLDVHVGQKGVRRLNRTHGVRGEGMLKVLEVSVWGRGWVYLGPFACALASCPFFLCAKLEHLFMLVVCRYDQMSASTNLLRDDVKLVLGPVLVRHTQCFDVCVGPYAHSFPKTLETHL